MSRSIMCVCVSTMCVYDFLNIVSRVLYSFPIKMILPFTHNDESYIGLYRLYTG